MIKHPYEGDPVRIQGVTNADRMPILDALSGIGEDNLDRSADIISIQLCKAIHARNLAIKGLIEVLCNNGNGKKAMEVATSVAMLAANEVLLYKNIVTCNLGKIEEEDQKKLMSKIAGAEMGLGPDEIKGLLEL